MLLWKFFVKTYKYNLCFFVGILFFIFGQIFFTLKGVETVPFFNYGMYSEPFQKRTQYTYFALKINGEFPNLYNKNTCSKSFIEAATTRYKLLQKSPNDPILSVIHSRLGTTAQWAENSLANSEKDLSFFENWLHAYLQKRLGISIQQFSIERREYVWSSDGLIPLKSTK